VDDKTPNIDPHTAAWSFQVWISFLVALFATLGGTILLPVEWWAKGYLLMGTLFTVGSSFTLAKTVRDNHEAAKLRNRIMKAKSEKLLKDFELSEVA
jgi:hypothetical protein